MFVFSFCFQRTVALRINFYLLMLLLIFFLASCGGGGSGADQPSVNTDLSLSFSTKAVTMNYSYGDLSPLGASVSVTATRKASSATSISLYVGATTPTGQPDPNIEKIDVLAGGTSGSVTIRPAKNLKPGIYTGTLILKACPDPACSSVFSGTPYNLSYTINVFLPIRPNPSSLTLTAFEGDADQSTLLNLSRPISNPVTSSISYGSGKPGWLTLTTLSNGDMRVATSSRSLTAGVYSASIRLVPSVPDSEVYVPVTLTVGSGIAAPASKIQTVTLDTTVGQLSGSIPVLFNGVVTGSWIAKSNSPWLILSKSSGTPGQSITYAVDSTLLPPSSAFTTQSAQIDISATSDQGQPLTPVRMQVSLNLQKLAEANFASPVPVISGRPVDVIVRGKGFNNSGNISAQIKLGGLTPSSVSVINDTALSLHFSSIPAGTYPVQITNGLGLITNGATLVSIAPRAGVASVHDTSNLGQPKTMLYDSLHGDVYASYAASPISPTGLSTVIRFRPNGSGWQRTSLSIPGLIDIALSPDSTRLAAADTTNKINIIDLASFAVTESYQSSTPISYSGINNLEGALAFTNDGKLWLSGYNYFDLTSHSFGKTTFPCSSWCSVQGNLLVSRDGSRLIASSSGSVSPSGPMTYLDASDGLVHDNPAGLTFFYRNSSLSDNGKRFLFDGYSVYDQNFGKVGETARGVSLTRGAQLSPDGNRAYFANQSFTTPSTWSISVRDTSGPAGTQLSLPTVGSIDVPIKPSCEFSTGSAAANDTSNCFSTKMRIAPDGNSVIFLGDKYLVVVPIPQSMSGLSSLPASINLKKATSGGLY